MSCFFELLWGPQTRSTHIQWEKSEAGLSKALELSDDGADFEEDNGNAMYILNSPKEQQQFSLKQIE